MRKVGAADIGRVAKIGKNDLFSDFQALCVPLDQCGQRRFSAGGKGQQMQRAFVARLFGETIGASSSTTCALVPLNPNELTPAMRLP